MTVQTITGDAAKAVIDAQLAAHEGGIARRLAGYNAASAVSIWHGAIRAVEEFINLPRFGVDDPSRRAWLLSVPMGQALEADPLAARQVCSELQRSFGPAVAARFFHVILHLSGFAIEWSNWGQDLGKGSVQEVINITPDTILKITVAKWLTPNGTSISEKGLTPDYPVEVTQKDLDAKIDSQLDKAVQLLNQ